MMIVKDVNKMPETWLLLDIPSLSHRNFHAFGDDSPKGIEVAVFSGLFRDLKNLQRRFQTTNVAFAFDSGFSLRQQTHAFYKANRQSIPEEQRQAKARLTLVLLDLQRKLTRSGCKNVFRNEGYEADDIIASLVMYSPVLAKNQAIIVSEDHDLYQLLDAQYVQIWKMRNGGSLYTQEDFQKEWYGLHPWEWPMVKALAGCKSDGIAGVPGVAEITAAKFVAKKLGMNTKAYTAIGSKEGQATFHRNHALVSLPYEGCPKFKLRKDKLKPRKELYEISVM